ncbi:Uncharacterised protein [Bordetella pertussis]|nr:Uncharacterised protein [Bordetella pertussis]
MHDGVGHAHPAQQHAEEVEDAGENDGQVRRHGLGVDDRGHRIGGVVKAVDEFEGENECQRQDEAETYPEV